MSGQSERAQEYPLLASLLQETEDLFDEIRTIIGTNVLARVGALSCIRAGIANEEFDMSEYPPSQHESWREAYDLSRRIGEQGFAGSEQEFINAAMAALYPEAFPKEHAWWREQDDDYVPEDDAEEKENDEDEADEEEQEQVQDDEDNENDDDDGSAIVSA